MKVEECILIILCCILINNLYNLGNCYNIYEDMINIKQVNNIAKWKRNPKCEYLMSQGITDVVGTGNFENTNDDDWDVYFPCHYNEISEEIDEIKTFNNEQRMFIIDNADALSSKELIWENLVKKFGIKKASTIMPKSYDLFYKDDLERFKKEYDKNKIYIMKKNIQRQEGLKITKNKEEILR